MDKRVLKAILCGGLVAGTLDIVLVSSINLINPFFILRVVASGVLGKTVAYAGGLTASALGMVLQWLMSLLIAAIYVIASTRVALLVRQWISCGLVYGVVTFFVMNYVVVPLSMAASTKPFEISAHVSDLLLMLLYGLIIAFFAQRFASNMPAGNTLKRSAVG